MDGDGSDDFSIVVKNRMEMLAMLSYTVSSGEMARLAKFKAPEEEVFGSRQNLIEFAGNGNIKFELRIKHRTKEMRW
ncbi:MAG: hypothetical protein U0T69_12900 [Chitinophagales bacterium]